MSNSNFKNTAINLGEDLGEWNDDYNHLHLHIYKYNGKYYVDDVLYENNSVTLYVDGVPRNVVLLPPYLVPKTYKI
jgi:hypothetical protein